MNASKKRLLNLPNILTLARIGAVPVVVLLLLIGQGGPVTSIIAAVFYLLAILTDLLDGYLARRYKMVTNMGKFLDPVADKLINAGALIMLIPLGRVWAIVAFLILGREIAVTGLRGIAVSEGTVIAASRLGKQKTLSQNIAIFCLIWHYPILFNLDIQKIGSVLIWVAVILTYWSGYNYFTSFYKILKKEA